MYQRARCGVSGALVLATVLTLGLGRHAAFADPVNIAPLGSPTQSSTYPGYAATKAIDGVFDNFTHTATDDWDATWEIDLGQTYEIDMVVLHNRTGCCQSRLRDITSLSSMQMAFLPGSLLSSTRRTSSGSCPTARRSSRSTSGS